MPILVEPHHLHSNARRIDLLDRAQPADRDALVERIIGFAVMRRHLGARAPIDDHWLGSETPRGARRVHGRVAAAIDGDTPPETRFFAALDVSKEFKGIVDPARVLRRNVQPFAQVRPNREKHRVESAVDLLFAQIGDFVIQFNPYTHRHDALDFSIEHPSWQAILRNPEVHHAAGQGTGVVDDNVVPAQRQMPRGGEAARTRADNQNPLARTPGIARNHPAML
jgi:hypothetical protein